MLFRTCFSAAVCLLASFAFLIPPALAQQEDNELINSHDLIQQGVAYHDEGQYDKAIKLYKKIGRNDSNYCLALVELSLSYFANEQEKLAIEVCKKGLALDDNPYRFNFYNILGSAYDNLNETELALKAYNEGLAIFPRKHLLHFNKGLLFKKTNQYDSAIVSLQKAIACNPYHASSHYHLGKICIDQGRLVPGLLSYEFFLLLEPYSKRSSELVIHMEQLMTDKYEYDKTKAVDPSKITGDDFAELELLLKSKVALNKSYKLKVKKIDYPFTRQMQVMFEKLKYNPGDKGWWMQYYVPVFTDMWKKNQFPIYVYWSLASMNLKGVNNWLDKNEKKLKELVAWRNAAIEKIQDEREEFVNGKMQKLKHWYFNDNSLNALGNVNSAGKSIGDWVFFTYAGELQAAGSYDNSGFRQGEWTFYHDNGKVSEITTFKDGQPDGVIKSYYRNGALASTLTFMNGKQNGETREYHPTGELRAVMQYKDGKKDGPVVYYHPNGVKQYETVYKNDQLEGEYKQYYDNGQVSTALTFKADKKEGKATYYWRNGKVRSEGTVKDGNETGDWKYYYDDGTLRYEFKLNEKGNYTGIYKSYHPNGKLKEESNYGASGKLEGVSKSYHYDGSPEAVFDYKDDGLQSYKYFDLKGAVISEGARSGKKLTFVAKYPNGNKRAQGDYINGMKEGEWSYYDYNGTLSTREMYKNDELNGISTGYHYNGKVRFEVIHKNGELNGYYKSYYKNGKMKAEGWYKNGVEEGDWYYYHANGKLSSHEYYWSGELHGWQEYYTVTGAKHREMYYRYDFLNETVEYDTTGAVTDRNKFNYGDGEWVLKFPNGKTYFSSQMKNGLSEGKTVFYYPNGTVMEEGSYYNDKKEGAWKGYHENGKQRFEYNYEDGKMHGTSKRYHSNGNLESEVVYRNGDLHGPAKYYHENKQLQKEAFYREDMSEGTFKYYSQDGMMVSQRTYTHDMLVSYTYQDKTGKMAPDVPLSDDESGQLLTYFPNGNKALEQTFKNGNIEGKRVEYFSNGKVYEEENYVNGNLEGPRKEYYPSGNLKAEENFYYDEPDGWCKYYHDNGKVEKEGKYIFGQRYGEWKEYDKMGKLVKIKVYINDILIDEKKP
ncbi:MAG: hypothetical protein AB1458_10380 [Bacteroidota bacterium]